MAGALFIGYHARVNPAQLGYPIIAYARLRVARDHFQRVISLARDITEVRECHRASGEDDFIMKVMAPSREALDGVFNQFRPYGEIHAYVILSTPVEKYST